MDKGGAKRPQECGGKFSKRYNRVPPRFPMRKLIARSFAFYRGKANSERERFFERSAFLLLASFIITFMFFFSFFLFSCFRFFSCFFLPTDSHDFEPSSRLEETPLRRNAGEERIIRLIPSKDIPLRSPFCNKMCGPRCDFCLLQNGLSRYDECQVHRPCRKMKIRLSFAGNRAHGKRELNTRRTPRFRSFRFQDKCPFHMRV